MNITIGTFVERYEKAYGDILQNKKHFVMVYNTYRNKNTHLGWDRWSWEPYEYYTRIPNHTRTEFDSFIADKKLHRDIRQHIHVECETITNMKKIIYS